MQRISIQFAACLICVISRAHAGATDAPTIPVNPASGSGDFVGDCFSIPASISEKGERITGGDYFVSAQKSLDNGDRALMLLKSSDMRWVLPCKPDMTAAAETKSINASALMAAGATRVGWTYGMLTMPYKYYPGTRTFSVNAPIGAYVGLRRGIAGSGHTYAIAFTLSSVKADTLDSKTLVDGKPAVTGTTDVAALSLSAGVMLDILKSATGKPFKAGVFVGVDRINRSPTISYSQNGKAWVALQLGYDFTDN